MGRQMVSHNQERCGKGVVRVEKDGRGRLFVRCTGHDFDNQVERGTIAAALGAMAAHLLSNR